MTNMYHLLGLRYTVAVKMTINITKTMLRSNLNNLLSLNKILLLLLIKNKNAGNPVDKNSERIRLNLIDQRKAANSRKSKTYKIRYSK